MATTLEMSFNELDDGDTPYSNDLLRKRSQKFYDNDHFTMISGKVVIWEFSVCTYDHGEIFTSILYQITTYLKGYLAKHITSILYLASYGRENT